ncbi:MAG: tetratricopeptide repeat protein [Phycisphaerae bacterium]
MTRARNVPMIALLPLLLAGCGPGGFLERFKARSRPAPAVSTPPGAQARGDAAHPTVDAPPPKLLPQTRISAAQMLESEGNFAGAIEQYQQALAEDPQNVDALARLGVACNRMRRFEEAIRAFARAIEIDPNRATLHNNLGFSYVLTGRLADAETSFRHALALKPDYQRAHMNLGAVLAQTGRSTEAVAEFEKVVPRDAAYYNLGLILATDKRYAAAEEAFRHSLALNPSSKEALAQLQRLALARSGTKDATVTAPPGASPIIASVAAPAAGDPAPPPPPQQARGE